MKVPICYFFSFLAEAVIIWQYTSNLFTPKRPIKMRLTVLSALYFILFIVSLIESRWLNVSFYFLLNLVYISTQYEIKWTSAFFHTSILTAVMGMCELMVYGIVKFFSPHFLEGEKSFISLVLFAIFNKLIFLTIIHILVHCLPEHKNTRQLQDKTALFLIFIPISSIFAMLTLINVGETITLAPSLNWMIALSGIFLLVSNLLVFGINQYSQKKNLEYMEMQLLLQKEQYSAEYYEMLRLQNENQQILIHDTKKHLQSIDLLNGQKEHEKISIYIRQLLHSSDLKEVSRLCDHEMLNSILCRYIRQCMDNNIDFHTDIRSGTIDFVSDNDLTSIFCNLIDNAMEAAHNVPHAYIEVSTYKKDFSPLVVITVINSCREDPFSKQQSGLTTSKADKLNHGFGIKSIRKAIKKYNGNMQMYYDKETFTFHTIITLRQH